MGRGGRGERGEGEGEGSGRGGVREGRRVIESVTSLR